jgi:hypothetical protein
LTDGPAIFIAEDVGKIGSFYLQQSGIPESVLDHLQNAIENNSKLAAKMMKLRQEFEDLVAKDSHKDKKMSNDLRLPPAAAALQREIDGLATQVLPLSIDKVYIPNTMAHQKRWRSLSSSRGASSFDPTCFTCDLDPATVEKIMALDSDAVPVSWKILLLMGIGAFFTATSTTTTATAMTAAAAAMTAAAAATAAQRDEYFEIMKRLADDQKLFLIIASSDYIYGTNYQFCHGILGKDLSHMTRQKTIQAMGRVGRGALQQTYTIRVRNDDLLKTLFLGSTNMEAQNMCRLFCF